MHFRVVLTISLLLFADFNLAIAEDPPPKEKANLLPNFSPSAVRDRVTIELSKAFKNLDEQYAFEDALIAALKKSEAGDFDGALKSVDGSVVLFYVYSDDIQKAEKTISDFLQFKGYFNGAVLEMSTVQKDGTRRIQRRSLL
jgi:hypothetical protein